MPRPVEILFETKRIDEKGTSKVTLAELKVTRPVFLLKVVNKGACPVGSISC